MNKEFIGYRLYVSKTDGRNISSKIISNMIKKKKFVTVSDIIFAFCHYFRRRKYLDINYDFNNRKINKIIKKIHPKY